MPKFTTQQGQGTAILSLNSSPVDTDLYLYKRLPCKYVLGKIDKTTNKLTLYKTKFVLPLNTTRLDTGVEKTYRNEFNQKRMKLVEKKAKNEIKAELLEEQMDIDATIGNISNESDSIGNNSVIAAMGLPLDFGASAAEKVYDQAYYFQNVDTIDVQKLWKSKDTNSAQEQLKPFGLEQTQAFIYGLVVDRLQKKDIYKKEGLKRVIMIQLLVQLFKKSKKPVKFHQITKNSSMHQVFELFAEKDSDSNAYRVSSQGRDKILLFIMIQLLLIQQLRFDCSLLAKDLGLSTNEY